ncbi:hypothetical protein ACHWQZ_G002978 [Mnemiopsis leidyi]
MSNLTTTVKHALGNSVIEFSVSAPETQMLTPDEGLEVFWPGVRMILDRFTRRWNCFKFQVTFEGVFQKHINDAEEQTFGFKTRATMCLRSTKKNELIDNIRKKILESYESFQGMGRMSYYLPTPHVMKKRRCLLNIQNKDDRSFLYCVVAAFKRPDRNAYRPGFYKPYVNKIITAGISINVFGYSEDEPKTHIFPLYTMSCKSKRIVNLLCLTENDRNHFVLIKSLSTFLRLVTKYEKKMVTCERCFRRFSSQRLFQKHATFCETREPAVLMPEDSILKFKNFQYKFSCPVVMYADFEAYQISMNESIGPKSSNIAEQKPTGFAYTIVSPYNVLQRPLTVYRGEDAATKFVDCLIKECYNIEDILCEVEPMDFTENDMVDFETATTCSICNQNLVWDDLDNPVVRDHCHISGSFRGAAHSQCNLRARQQKKLFVYFHNGKGYDNHFILTALASDKRVGAIEVIANTAEKYTQIKTQRFVIHDSMSHLIGSLENLCKSLRQRGLTGFSLMRNEFPLEDQFNCVLQKLIYPYDYIDGFEIFEETIPDKSAFFNKLTNEDLSDDDYQKLLKICRVFNITTLGELHDLYLRVDVLILACVFEDYRRLGLEMFAIDPAYYISSPSYSFDAMLHLTNVELELLTDEDMYEFFEKGMRGGCSTVFKRLVTANNQGLKRYNNRVPQSSIFYTDCNNLYGYCMQMKLPHKDFSWLNEQEITSLDVTEIDSNGDVGLILEAW